MAQQSPSQQPLVSVRHVAAALLGWLLPGLGHWLIGQRQRAVILCLAIGGLWLAGALIGGIGVFDRKEHKMWFLGQMLVAPSVVVDVAHESLATRYGPPLPNANPPAAFSPAYGRTQEQGLLYSALAGMLNLLAMVDVLYRQPPGVRLEAAGARTEA
ncbi:MAG: hypothetical protein IT445_10460 [Phycisphaeraceae bacterium]|nr:hypothetical protein [Phycisphaeraceae bacterium]